MKKNHPHAKIIQVGILLLIFVVFALTSTPYNAFANEYLFKGNQLSLEQNSNSGVISARENSVDQTASHQPWSLARMEAAQPYQLPQVTLIPETPANLIQPDTEPVYIPSVPPTINPSSTTRDGNDPITGEQLVTGYDYPAPYSRYEIFDSYQVFPYSTVGILFFSQGGQDYRCSAAVVGKNALWTAGHCVHDGINGQDGWSDNVVFVPAYKDGDEPYGSWSYFDLVTRMAWYESGDLRYDIGGVVLNPNDTDQSIDDVVGRLGFAYNLDPIQHWFNFGYPSNAPFDGKTMQVCVGSFARNATSTTPPVPVGMGCDMTPGSSGGPWIINFSGSNGDTNYMNGNNSFRYTGFGEEIYSPYFGDEAVDLLFYIATEAEVNFPIIHSSGDQ